ncbi:MAG TPA: hypothetical protein VEK56_06330 [Vicinamibacterales bacterium]|nr:hypothetical protein [Vicinamibacterales bacterium]
MSPRKLQPALLGGIALGVLSALPVVNLANLCCCAWVIFGGALAAYLMQQSHPAPINAGDGAIVGLLAGIFGAMVSTLLSIPIALAMGPFQAQILDRVLESARDLPPEVRSILENMRGGPALGLGLILSFIGMLIVGSFFGLIGGIVGALLFSRNVPPPPPPPVPTAGL